MWMCQLPVWWRIYVHIWYVYIYVYIICTYNMYIYTYYNMYIYRLCIYIVIYLYYICVCWRRWVSMLCSSFASQSLDWFQGNLTGTSSPWWLSAMVSWWSPGITEPGNKKGMHSINIVSANLLATRTWKFGNGGLQGTSMYKMHIQHTYNTYIHM